MSIATNTIPLSATLETHGDVIQGGGRGRLIGNGPNFLLNDSEMSKTLRRCVTIANKRNIIIEIDFLSNYICGRICGK